MKTGLSLDLASFATGTLVSSYFGGAVQGDAVEMGAMVAGMSNLVGDMLAKDPKELLLDALAVSVGTYLGGDIRSGFLALGTFKTCCHLYDKRKRTNPADAVVQNQNSEPAYQAALR